MLSFLAIKKGRCNRNLWRLFYFYMHFSKIWVRKNFIPNIVEDKFGREDIGVEVFLNEGESMDEAIQQARQFMKEYIEKNTVYHSPNISDGLPPEPTVLPSIQARDMPLSQMPEDNDIEKAIWSCNEVKVLESYRLLAKCEKRYQVAYDTRMDQLQQLNVQKSVIS